MAEATERAVHVVSFSEISTMRQCAHKHQLAWRERWRPSTESPALTRGSLWHKALETHYGHLILFQDTGVDPDLAEMQDSFEAVLAESSVDEEEKDKARWMYAGYLEAYGFDVGWTILAAEYNQTVDLPDLGPEFPLFRLKFKIDLIIKDELDRTWSLDHKTAKNMPKGLELELDDQHGLYTWGLHQLGKNVYGSIHNLAKTEKLKRPMTLEDRFKRLHTYRSETELETIAWEAVQTAGAAYAWEPGTAPRSPDPSTCGWKCDFIRPCMMGRKGADERGLLVDLGFTQNWKRH